MVKPLFYDAGFVNIPFKMDEEIVLYIYGLTIFTNQPYI